MASSVSTSKNNDISLHLGIFRKRLWMILLIFAVTMIVILGQALLAKPVYRAAVRLQIIPLEPGEVELYSQSTSESNIDLMAIVFREVADSGIVAWRTIGQLGLSLSAEELLRNITTSQQNDFVTITVEADSPQAAEAIATAQVDNALALYRDDRLRPTTVIGEFIEGQLALSEQTLATARSALQQFKLEHAFDSLEREIVGYQDTIRSLRREQDGAILAIAQLKARIRVLEAEIEAFQVAADAAKEGSDEKSLAIRRASEQANVVANLRGDLAAQEALHLGYDATIKRWETELTSLIGFGDEYARLTNAVTRAENTRDFLFNKALEAGLKQQQAQSIGYLRVVEPARLPDQPVPSRTLQIAVIGGVLSLVVGAVLALLFEWLESASARPVAEA